MKHFFQRFVYRLFRKLKVYFLQNPSLLGKLFFLTLGIVEILLSERNTKKKSEVELKILKNLYYIKYGKNPLFEIISDYPVAKYSDDHKWPRGTIQDNSVHRPFNLKLYDYFKRKPDLAVLDLGCSGGGMVTSILDDGYFAIGIEGSNWSQRLRAAEWDISTKHLFTADISKPFEVRYMGEQANIKFDCITMWEVLEHIHEKDLSQLFFNIKSHLKPNGVFIGSVDMEPDGNLLTGANYHVTLQSKAWWLQQFVSYGFEMIDDHPFEIQDFVRGNGLGLKDWDPKDGSGFHVVMRLRS